MPRVKNRRLSPSAGVNDRNRIGGGGCSLARVGLVCKKPAPSCHPVAVSKAFTREDETGLPLIVPPRAPLPEGVPNYVTSNGLAQLRDELARLGAEQERVGRDLEEVARTQALAALTARRVELEHRIANAELVAQPAEGSVDEVRFGATVSVETEVGLRQYSIVGVDEADPARGKIAFVSPLARALLGRSVGEVIQLRTPRGEEALRIDSVRYDTN